MQNMFSDAVYATDKDRADCRELIRHGSRSFFAASLLLPAWVREPAYAVYGFCRLADDGVDLGTDKHAAVARMMRRLDGIYGGAPDNIPADRALADVVLKHNIPRVLFDALIEGLAWDAEGRRYETIGDLYSYGARVAGAVGTIMARLMKVHDPDALARACDLGVAMQLTNIARDVGEDAREGRIYLPLAWMREAGIDPDAWLANPVHTDALASVVERLLADAERLYRKSESGIARLPLSCRPAIHAARCIYAAIGDQVTRKQYDSITSRAVVSTRRKVGLAGWAAFEAALLRVRTSDAALAETKFLVDACEASPPPGANSEINGRIEWLLDLCGRLEERETRRVTVREMARMSRLGGLADIGGGAGTPQSQ